MLVRSIFTHYSLALESTTNHLPLCVKYSLRDYSLHMIKVRCAALHQDGTTTEDDTNGGDDRSETETTEVPLGPGGAVRGGRRAARAGGGRAGGLGHGAGGLLRGSHGSGLHVSGRSGFGVGHGVDKDTINDLDISVY
jgi:hypothetical protein